MKRPSTFVARLTFAVTCALTIVLSGCASVDHVNTYREAREIYNEATGSANNVIASQDAIATADASASTTTWAPPPSGLSTGFSDSDYSRLHKRYTEVVVLLRALHTNNESRNALKQDRLLGTSLTVQLLSEWKAAFYARLLEIDAAPDSASGALPEPTSIANLRARHKEVMSSLKSAEAAVFPRDQFLLSAFLPLLRYDNAFLYAAQWSGEERFDDIGTPDRGTRLASVKSIVQQMAQAERELAALAKVDGVERHIQLTAVAARQNILRTATALVLEANVNMNSSGLWTYADASTALPDLTAALRVFATEVVTSDEPANVFIRRLGVDLTGADPNRDALSLVGRYWTGSWPSNDASAGEERP